MIWLAKIGAAVAIFFSSLFGTPTVAPSPITPRDAAPAERVSASTTVEAPLSAESAPMKEAAEKDRGVWQRQSTGPQPCSNESAAFTQPITTRAAVSHITPGSTTGDARYTYLWINGQQSVPVFAPADGVLIKITYKVRTDLPPSMSEPDYDLAFEADCHTVYVINHITDPAAEIAAAAPVTEPIEIKPGSGVSDTETTPTQRIQVKAGQLLGTTTGTPAARNFDFGVFVDGHATCPYEQFSEPARSLWLALFNGASCAVAGSR